MLRRSVSAREITPIIPDREIPRSGSPGIPEGPPELGESTNTLTSRGRPSPASSSQGIIKASYTSVDDDGEALTPMDYFERVPLPSFVQRVPRARARTILRVSQVYFTVKSTRIVELFYCKGNATVTVPRT